ncbi:hypothetical protein BYT27DRAFT_7033318, partial [Phlegmacium glaucopus]
MVYRPISADMKRRALQLLEDGWEMHDIADVLDVAEDLRNLIQESPELYLDEIGVWLALYHEVQISTTALHENLRELGLTRKLMRRAAAERDHKLRANWMYNILSTYTAEQM